MTKLREKEMMCAELLTQKGASIRATAQQLGVAESTLRYRLQRRSDQTPDGRTAQSQRCAPHAGVIDAWITQQAQATGRPESIQSLYEALVHQHGFTGSYKAVWRYVHRRREPPKLRPKRRVETQPGTQAQVDWGQRRLYVEELGGWTGLSAFHMSLSYSRMWSIQWSVDQSQWAWLGCHNRAFTFLEGIAWSVRIDNLKTGVIHGGGPTAVLNAGYQSYAQQLGFIIDPCRIRHPADKGKVERRVGQLKRGLIGAQERFSSLAHLQRITDERIQQQAQHLSCPVTGQSIEQTWHQEKAHLCPLPVTLPHPFDVQVTRTVGTDCLVCFEQRQYAVPFAFVGRAVEVRGALQTVEIYGDGRLLITYPRQTESRLLIDQSCYEGEATDRVHRPTPLGQMGRLLVRPKSWEAASRPLDTYATLVDQLARSRS